MILLTLIVQLTYASILLILTCSNTRAANQMNSRRERYFRKFDLSECIHNNSFIKLKYSIVRSKLDCSFQCFVHEECDIFTYSEKFCQLYHKNETVYHTFCSGDTETKIPVYYFNQSIIEVKSNSQDLTNVWIVIQRRLNGAVDFSRSWNEYKNGFGDSNGEFWLGNDRLHALTSAASFKIRFELWDESDGHVYAEYSTFSVEGEALNYLLEISGYSGNASDSMSQHSSQQFSTTDRDNDGYNQGSCSNEYGNGGWWYASNCYAANLNGEYFLPGTVNGKSINWWHWKGNNESLKKVIIKIIQNQP